jgi:hypothetical protein
MRATFVSLSFIVCLGCSERDVVDFCVENGKTASPPVGCDGNPIAVLATSENSHQRWDDQVAYSHQAVALDDENVYWADVKGNVLKTPKSGGSTKWLLGESPCSISDVAAVSGVVYFGQNCSGGDVALKASVQRLDQTTGPTVLWWADLLEVRQVQPVGDRVYFTSDDFASSWLFAVPSDGKGNLEILLQTGAAHLPFIIDAGALYYGDNAAQQVRRRDLETGDETVIADVTSTILSLHLIGGALHFRVSESGTQNSCVFHRVSASGEGSERAYDGICPELVSGDASGYYGAGQLQQPGEASAFRVGRWLAPDFTLTLLAAGLNSPQAIAMDETHLFVTDLSMFDDPMKLRLLRVQR